MTRLLNEVVALEWREIANNLLAWGHPVASGRDTDSTTCFSPPDPRTKRRDRRRGAGFGPGFSEAREGEDMSQECVWLPCPEQTRHPRINRSLVLGGKVSDGSAGPLIWARSICDSRHRRATVKRSPNLSNNPRWNWTVQQRQCWNAIATSPNSQLQLLSCFVFFSLSLLFNRRAARLTLCLLLSLVTRTLHSPLREFMGSQGNVWTSVTVFISRLSCDHFEFSLLTA